MRKLAVLFLFLVFLGWVLGAAYLHIKYSLQESRCTTDRDCFQKFGTDPLS